ncbi:MAG: hypothetical protein ABH879_03285 [archaeon]
MQDADEKEVTIKTDVDALVDLVKERKRISFDEVAKTLKLEVSAVEDWAAFLEEEGVIGIDYKFTTPFLVTIEQKKKPQEKIPVVSMEAKLARLNQLMDEAHRNIEKGEFEMAKRAYPHLFQDVKDVHSYLRSFYKGESPSGDKVVSTELDKIPALLEQALRYTENGEIEKAKQTYLKIYSQIKEVFGSLKEIYYEVRNIADRKPAEKEAPKDAKSYGGQIGGDNFDDMLKTAYELMSRGDVDEAKKLYAKIEEYYNRLPAQYQTRKTELKKDLLKLNRDLALNIDVFYSKRIRSVAKDINSLLPAAAAALEKDDIQKASRLYGRIRKLLEELPSGFVQEKIELQDRIVQLHDQLILKKRDVYTREVSAIRDRVDSLISDIRTLLKSGKTEEAVQVYNRIKGVFQTLPNGFFHYKVELHSKILQAYREILETKEHLSSDTIEKLGNQIKKLVDAMDKHINETRLEEAAKVYDEISSVYEKLPSGFLSEKIGLQDTILKLYEKLITKRRKQASAEMEKKSRKLEEILATAAIYLKKKQFDLANELFHEAMRVYGSLPGGFLELKTNLHNRILDLYKNVMLGIDESSLDNVDNSTKKKYQDLLKLLVNFRKHIDASEFSLLETNFHYISQLYQELPLGFVMKNIKMRHEIVKLKNEIELYKMLEHAESLAGSGKTAELANAVSELKKKHEDISKTAPEDRKFFSFIQKMTSKLEVHDSPKPSSAGFEFPSAAGPKAVAEALPEVQPEALPGLPFAEPKTEPAGVSASDVATKTKAPAPAAADTRHKAHRVRGWLALARRSLKDGNYSGAIDAVQSVVQEDNKNQEARELLVEIKRAIAGEKVRLKTTGQETKGKKGSVPTHGSIRAGMAGKSATEMLVQVKLDRAGQMISKKDYLEAEHDIAGALKLDSANKRAKELLETLRQLKISGDTKKPEEKPANPSKYRVEIAAAITKMQRAPSHKKETADNMLIRAKLDRAGKLAENGKFEDAMNDISKVIDMDPNNAAAKALLEAVSKGRKPMELPKGDVSNVPVQGKAKHRKGPTMI